MQRCLLTLFVCSSGIAVSAQSPGPQTVAILPFANVSNTGMSSTDTASLDWIGESVAETLREAAGARGLAALERNELLDAYHRLKLRERLPLADASVLKIGEVLDAEQVVFGRFEYQRPTPGGGSQPADNRGSLRITARVYDRHRMRQTPEFSESGSLEDLATLEAHLSWRALSLLAPELAPPESEFRSLRTPIRLDAEENYIRGLLAETPDMKEKYFTQAARLDARFAHPAYQLGQLHYNRKEYKQAAEWLEKVGSGDIHFREANFLLGLARFRSGDYAAAQKAFQMIVTVVPLSSVYNNLGAAESRRNLPQAVDDFRKALEGDLSDSDYHFNLGYALWKKGDFGAAADRFRSVLERVPEDEMSTLLLGRCLKKQGFNAAIDARLVALERLKSNYEERAWRQLKSMLDSSLSHDSNAPQSEGGAPKTVESKSP
jgi:tetratricopeptide (TPR) repeat protein